MEISDFPCTGCTLCCKNLKSIHSDALRYPEGSFVRIAAETFPFNWDSSGSCLMLEDGLCSVYASRPLLCNVKALSSLWASEVGCSVNDLYALTADACNKLIDSAGMNPEFKIDPDQFR